MNTSSETISLKSIHQYTRGFFNTVTVLLTTLVMTDCQLKISQRPAAAASCSTLAVPIKLYCTASQKALRAVACRGCGPKPAALQRH
jgi:hypothetical protein